MEKESQPAQEDSCNPLVERWIPMDRWICLNCGAVSRTKFLTDGPGHSCKLENYCKECQKAKNACECEKETPESATFADIGTELVTTPHELISNLDTRVTDIEGELQRQIDDLHRQVSFLIKEHSGRA